MPHSHKPDEIPEALVIAPRRVRLSVVWLIPALAAVVALGIAAQRFLAEGPTIAIVFAAGDGIEAGKTQLKYKDVSIGQVIAVRLVEKYSKVEVTARITKTAAGLMGDDTQFWVVAPHIGLSGISGIGTLLSGNYIAVQVGKSEKARRRFMGLDIPPRITDQKGRRYILSAPNLGSLSPGAPTYYRGMVVGEVESSRLAVDGKSVEIGVFVYAPYDAQVHAETRFWNAGGVDLSIGEAGLDVRTASLLALLAGGMSFETPDYAGATPPAPEGTAFHLYGDRTTALKQPDAYARRYVLLFDESVRGLQAGAPVTLLGLTVGEVTEVGLRFDPKTLDVRARVFVTFFPERAAMRFPESQQAAVRSSTERDAQAHLQVLRRLVDERGLRAQLRSSSLLTGQRYVAFEFLPHAAKARVAWNVDPLELPVVPGQLADLEAKLESILSKIDHMPLEAIGERIAKVLQTLDSALRDADQLLKHVNSDAVPQLRRALEDAHLVLDGVNNTLVGRDAPAQQDLREALIEVTRAARALREFADYLDRHPESLLRGKREKHP